MAGGYKGIIDMKYHSSPVQLLIAIFSLIGIFLTTISNAAEFKTNVHRFKAYFQDSVSSKTGMVDGLYGQVKETSYFSRNEHNEFYLITIHDYRQYEKRIKIVEKEIIEFAIEKHLLKSKTKYKRVSPFYLNAQKYVPGSLGSGPKYSREKVKCLSINKCEEVRSTYPYDTGVLYTRSRLLFKNGFLYWIQVVTNNFKRSTGPDQSFFIHTVEIW